MKKTLHKAVLLALAAVFVLPFTACKRTDPPADVDANYAWLPSNLAANGWTDSSDLPSWTQKTLSLKAWNGNQSGAKQYTSSEDKVWPELERLTGVGIDKRASVDNNGVSVSVAYENMVAADALPDVGFGTFEMAGIIDPRDVYDLTEYVQKYCPTILRRMPESVWGMSHVNGGKAGKIYGVPFGLGNIGLSVVDPEADPARTKPFEFYEDYYGKVYVREDILQDVFAKYYPGEKAYTAAELENIYMENGAFTEEQLLDVGKHITNADEFYGFLDKIYGVIHDSATAAKYALPLGKSVTPILANDGQDRDTWSLMSVLWPRLMGASGALNTMYSYWDADAQTVKVMARQPFFKDYLEDWAAMVAEGRLTNNDGAVLTFQNIQSKLNKGHYAVTYENALAAGQVALLDDTAGREGEQVRYRKVYLKIEKDPRFEFFAQREPQPQSFLIFKTVPEGDIPQILQWLDLQQSEIGDRLLAWGPRAGGLWTEENGARRYTSEDLKKQMVDEVNTIGSLVERYNLSNGRVESPQWTFPFFYCGGSKEHPLATYSSGRSREDVESMYSSAAVTPHTDVQVQIARRACMWTWTDADLPGIQEMWSQRGTVEQALQKVLISKTQGQPGFNSAYNNLIIALNTVGWQDEYFAGAYTDTFKKLNSAYLSGFVKG
ncbi:MAG: hypothetical protein LBL66_07750 [Clostridiales bacterium]|jgi:hypothetical protein|nr:hypothetical protein [Clostridiales bacterium]